ncbi:hypothetical protein B0H99_1092 [Planomicrobium soli]|uniref:Uncharacterized protein n=1 Tax=Planomicrobium soli TaxID=1176648 RepID=A0A2P8GJZ0_9BACL|nr:hypothetical protein [Planomicrobium soli]PSL34278.1 hypothetical protein B0H99_1092 [Planomicrobium soli]
MATKLKNDLWSIVAVIIALFSLLYCFSFIWDIMFYSPAADVLAALRTLTQGDA